VDGGERLEDNGWTRWGIPPESRILDSWAWISSGSKREVIDIGRMVVLSMPFNPVPNSFPSMGGVKRPGFLLSCTAGSKAP